MNMFRVLRADEIECRIAQVKKDLSGLSLLLYKDARCDQNILDEVVGPMNWKREHTRDNRNCIVSLWDAEKGQWVSKEDTGTESNTEREKGLASDSFKRSCVNWGIGRELYTAPYIWVNAKDCRITKDGKCYDRFTVKGIGYTDGVITGLEIKNQATGKVCYKWGEINEEAPDKPEQPDDEPEKAEEPKKISAGVIADKVNKLPESAAPQKEEQQVSEVEQYLLKAMKELREARGITATQNNKLFKDQHVALVEAKMAPNKPLAEYTLEEAHALIDAMYANFSPEGTEIKE